MEGTTVTRKDLRGFGEVLGGGDFSFGIDDDGTAFALSLGLFTDGAHHVCWQVDVLQFDGRDLYAPGEGRSIDDLFDLVGNDLALREQFVEGYLARDVAHGGLGELEHGVVHVLDVDDRPSSIDDLVVDDRIDLGGDVVFSDGVLRRNIDGFQAKVDLAHGLKDGDNDTPTWFGQTGVTAHSEAHATLVLLDLAERCEDEDDSDPKDGDEKSWHKMRKGYAGSVVLCTGI